MFVWKGRTALSTTDVVAGGAEIAIRSDPIVLEGEEGADNFQRQMAITGKAGSTLSKVMGNSRTRTPVAL